MEIQDSEIKRVALEESMHLHEVAGKEPDSSAREHRTKLLLHLSIYNLAQAIVAKCDGDYGGSKVLVEAMEIKDLIIEATHEIAKKIQTGELKFSKESNDGNPSVQ